ncbi:VOC family protein [Streptacidiphilus rugosus]|uniref:VOC family protein n=1 Tax=Streptacidiphilus rugosus TaxID=405783 RepID=UPI00056B93BB|nr:VOC family protein [Streptacidiphilus rugosus]
MLSTTFVDGGPVWIDLGSPDVKATTAFYTQLFGWTAASAGPEAGGYVFFQQGGKTAAACGPLSEEAASGSWTVYFGTHDIDVAAKSVDQAGGHVRVAPMDVMDEGRMGQFTDAQGAQFALWKPGKTQALGAVNTPGTLCWTELHTPDTAAARTFYDHLFSWQVKDMDMPGGMTYTTLCTADDKDAFGGLMPARPGEKPGWRIYFEVADCDATTEKAKALGGKVLDQPETMSGVGRMATLADPHGAPFSVITSESQQES